MSAVEKLDNIEAICFFPKDFDGSRRFFEDKWGFQPKRIQPTVENPNFIEYSFRGATIAIWARDAVAEIMGEHEGSIRRGIAEGRIPADKVNGRWRICRDLVFANTKKGVMSCEYDHE